METGFLYSDTQFPTYYQFPKFLLSQELDLSQTARIAYMLLYDRARISMENGWVDEEGHVFIRYTFRSLAGALGKGTTSTRDALRELERAGLLYREHGGFGKPNLLYVKCPVVTEFRHPGTDFRHTESRFSDTPCAGYPTPNKNKRII